MRQNIKRPFFYLMISFILMLLITSCSTAPGNQTAIASSIPLEIDVSSAHQLWEDGAFMLDVRQPEEWEAGHIPGATLIPLGELSSRINEVPEDKTVVVVCRTGNRSATGRDILLDAGYEQVTSMDGGMVDWANSGYDVVAGQ